ncbi:NFX1-type zinc finger-containing protein 1-like isoform X2 [Actinia tenebrosa]|uniref:NFX1-type zinc finger-containing protein 1-like isoform X1 n=1 Tax=Actinia tenebrosa TaxID=6105 RepID=A0A6P8HNX8_ACTTE|nr:NFX1-type zinc finger-containing protein 1-like isoform X1 [Actinia tenebrosa]XP_031554355.1 NFX1-type zinc finger-containing protein 1-like isoform X1 [Actinia tenebrosa]XP_031554356.1 NFX1-type zinc finger-containing protein 1-like isoform X2 [Actinia tenebrosa]
MHGITLAVTTFNQKRLCAVENEEIPSLTMGSRKSRDNVLQGSQSEWSRSVQILCERRMSNHEEDLPVSQNERRMSRNEGDFPVSHDKRLISSYEWNPHWSRDERPMSFQERGSHGSRDERTMSRNERNSHGSRDERAMSRHKRDSHWSSDERPMSFQERGSHGSRDERMMSRNERNSHGSRDERAMSRHERNSHGSRDERAMSRHERDSYGSRDERAMSRNERDSHGSREERVMSRNERDSHGSRDERAMPRNERDSHGFLDERAMSSHERDSHGSREERAMSRNERDSHGSRDERTMPRHERDSHGFLDERAMSSHERDSHGSRDERAMSSHERDSHEFLDERAMSSHERDSHGSHDERAMSRHERDSHGSRDERAMSRHERDSHGSRDERAMSRHERDSHGSRDERAMSSHEMDSHGSRDERFSRDGSETFVSVAQSEASKGLIGSKKRRRECASSCFPHGIQSLPVVTQELIKRGRVESRATATESQENISVRAVCSKPTHLHSPPGTSGLSLSTKRTDAPQRKRKRSNKLENESIPEKKEKRDFNPIGYKALENICSKMDENEVMLQLVKAEQRYVALLNSQEGIREDLFKLVIDSLMAVINSTNRYTSANAILQATHKQLLGTHFPEFIMNLPQLNCSNEDELAEVIRKIISIFEALLQRFDKAVFYLVQMLVDKLSDKIHPLDHGEVGDGILHRIASLKAIKNPFHTKHGNDDSMNPPDDFRKISVVPNEEDFKEVSPFLRANVIKSTYKDTEHYLDVQFRLLREDFIMPLRERIQELRRKGSSYHGTKEDEDNTTPRQNTFLYKELKIINPVCHRRGGVYRVQINKQNGRLKHVNWRTFVIKRLKYGALVCLSADGFNTLLFATVENRDFCDLECGLLELRFENCETQSMQNAIENKWVFQMIESEAYFEAYRHNLSALQTMNEEKLPFKECIVHCKNADAPPSYIIDDQQENMNEDWNNQRYQSSDDGYIMDSHEQSYSDTEEGSVSSNDNLKYMDMTCIADSEYLQENDLDVSRVPVHNIHQWPCKEALGLDESQYRACQQALNHRFALIQGPPGTGKTYVGLKIAHALLDNRDLWSGEDRSPILMVSYTNHALDQFLMGLNNKQGVVRVGGRSKEEKLHECNIKELRTKRRNEKHGDDNQQERGRIWRERKEIEETYLPKEASCTIADGYKGVLSISTLKGFMKERHIRCFTSCSQENRSEDAQLLQWLRVEQKQPQDGDKHQVFQSEDFRKIISAGREFEVEGDDDDLPDETEGPAVVCHVNDARNPEQLYNNLQSQETMSDAQEESIQDLFRLPSGRRWDLYRLWRLELERYLQKRITDSQEVGYETLLMRLSEINADEDFYILRQAKIIAMTTTCAARYRDILQRIKPKIVIVEEAAEVLEAHILTSLPLDCEHVILIGDHQQLRPSCTVYELAKKYNLNISMFERLAKLQMPCVRLTVQHRMRPEIASLVRHIYKDLTNHQIVHDYEDVLGFQHNLFFIDHRHSESDSKDSFSHFNKHEARFLVRLCRYVIQQGYKPSQITILTPYLGQMLMIRDDMTEGLTEIRLSTIDNYQGEENDIILLSLVRSNDTGHVGFVNDINRACVALSRARMGLYVIGNFDLLSGKSGIWKKVVGDVRKNGRLGKELPLRCQRHTTKVAVKDPEDFQEKVPYGGCRLRCAYRLDCGHACTLLCHPYDQEHKEFRCNKPCSKIIHGCRKGHICRNICGQDCEPKCLYRVEMTLPCNHVKKNARCSDNPNHVKCDERCPKLLKCGHRCQARCGEPCTSSCKELVKRSDWPCGHEVTIACSASPLDCRGPCGGDPSCGHECSGSCGECLQGRVHRRCKKTCGRVLVCGHECRANCTITCPPCTNKCETKCKHSECRKKCGEPCVPCTHQCEWMCKHLKCSMKCGEICDRPRCDEPCRKLLQCKHRCRGLCNEPCICVECEKEEIKIFFGTENFDDETVRFIQLRGCKHIFEVHALDKWMDMGNDDQQEKNSIQPKVCPRCKTPIQTMMRYNNVIKKQLKDIERVKEKLFKPLSEERRYKVHHKLTQHLLDASSNSSSSSSSARRKRSHDKVLLKRIDQARNVFEIINIENQVELLTRCHNLIKKATETKAKIADKTSSEMKDVNLSILILNYLQERIVGSVEREITDIELELKRQKVVIEVCSLRTETKNRDICLKTEHRILLYDVRYTPSQPTIRKEMPELDYYLRKLEEIRSIYPIDPPTREEKDQIIRAMGLSKGHWYKCRQGHVYAIGECGGAMETGSCPECHDVIGGASHRLAEGNEVATEMDGAQYSAWSEQANMGNYDLQE